jgi:hypothetical protein
MVHTHFSHPCIVTWVLFNEGWGQYDTERLAKHLKDLDPSRLVDATTGWADRGVGDMIDKHDYPGPSSDKPGGRAAVLGEFGGLGLPMPGHMWSKDGWSYQGFKTQDELTNGFLGLLDKLHPLIASPGLSAAIYTQTSDVETELNGLLTYDRAVLKVNEDEVRKAIDTLYGPPPTVTSISPIARDNSVVWKYTTYQPDIEWAQPAYDDSTWASGASGFGTPGTAGSYVKTKWDQDEIWIRREFTVGSGVKWHSPSLNIHHSAEAEVYVDGLQKAALPGSLTTYELVPIKDWDVLLKPGKHVLAVHCRRGKTGQFIDCGIVDVDGKGS